jgi:site-specific DNA-methyltransferase (adenine-specific)
MKPITKHLGLEYDDVVPKFKNQKTHHSVWNYDMAKRNKVHITPKPIDLLENIIRHTTDEGDMILDCFAGSGSLGMAAKNTNRSCTLIEREAKYCAFIRSELEL